MNVLTGPVFTLSDGDTFLQASLQDILSGKHEGFRFSSGGTLQNLGQLWLACTLVQVLQNGEDLDPDDFLDILLERLAEDAPNYELLGEGFMQVPFSNPKNAAKKSGEVTVRNFLVADQTSSPFSKKLLLDRHSYCPACAAKDLFLFQKIVPGAGKGAGGPWGSGTLIFLDEGGDALKTLLANVLRQPTIAPMDPNRELLRMRGRTRTPTWKRPEFVSLLEEGSEIPLETCLDLTCLDLWLTRQVVLEHRVLEGEAPCISCGGPSRISVCGILDGVRKKNPAEGLVRDYGCLKLGFKAPSLQHPWEEREDKKDGVAVKDVALKTLRGGKISDLLPAAQEFFDPNSSKRAALLRGERMYCDYGKGRKSLRVFGLLPGAQAGTFGAAFEHNIPYQDSVQELGAILSNMNSEAQKTRQLLWVCVREGLKGVYDPKGAKPFQALAENEFAKSVEQFPAYLNSPDGVFGSFLRKAAREVYFKEVLQNPQLDTAARREEAAKNIPHPLKLGVSVQETPFSEAFSNYSKKAEDRGLLANLRRIQVTPLGVEATRTVFSSGIFSYGGVGDEVMRDAQILMIHLMPQGLRHEPGVSFGQGLRNACASKQDSDNEKAKERASALADAVKTTPQEFFFDFRNFVTRQNGLACDLNSLYWDLFQIFVRGDKSRATRWWVDLFRN